LNNFFERLVGQKQAIELLTQAVVQNRIAPAYLFTGLEGVGRSLAARCFVELLFCVGVSESQQAGVKKRLQQGNHPDLLWVEPTYLHQGQRLSATEAAAAGVKRKAPPQIRVEQIREISQFLGRSALESKRSLVVLEHAETMAEGAANSLLKTLEEPGQASLILIAPAVESLLPTLVSRCQRIPFYGLDRVGMEQVLKQTEYAEILQHEAILAIAQGSPGIAIAAWQQLQIIPQELLTQLTSFPKTPRHALELARKIDRDLDSETQLWLVDYLQYSYWQKYRQSDFLEYLEKTRRNLLNYAQPRLVWECTLLAISAQ